MTNSGIPETPRYSTLAVLRTRLADFAHLPGDTPVILQREPNGHRWRPFAAAFESMYVAESPRRGTAYMMPELIAAYPEDYGQKPKAPEGAVLAIVLSP